MSLNLSLSIHLSIPSASESLVPWSSSRARHSTDKILFAIILRLLLLLRRLSIRQTGRMMVMIMAVC